MLPSEDDVETQNNSSMFSDLHGPDEVQTFLQFAFQSTKFVLRQVDNAHY